VLEAIPVTVTPQVCPWGFNTASRAPTLLESASHMLCEIEHWTTTTASSLWADVQGFLQWAWGQVSSLWTTLQTLPQRIGAAISSAAQTALNAVKTLANDLWNRVKSVWDWVKAEASKAGSVVETALFIGLGILVLGAISGADYFGEYERRGGKIPRGE
jgi:phage-related protein